MDRRRALRRVALAAAGAGAATHLLDGAAAPAAVADERIARVFSAFCDTLVPADALTPAASTLGVPAAILADVRGDPLAERLVGFGCAWLDAACGGDFVAAAEARRVAVLEQMAAMPWESPAGRFFVALRNTVMADYYVQPASWRGLAIDRPPQPIGFPDAVR